MYLYNPSLEHATHEEEWVRWPLEILHRVKAGVEVDDLKCCHLTDHQSVLWAAGNISAIWRELHQVLGLLKCLREVHDAYNGCAQWFLCEENTQQSLWLLQSTLVSSLSKLSVGLQVTRTLWDSIWISKPLLIHIHPYLSCILQRLRHGPRRAPAAIQSQTAQINVERGVATCRPTYDAWWLIQWLVMTHCEWFILFYLTTRHALAIDIRSMLCFYYLCSS